MSVPSLADVKATMSAKAAALGYNVGTGGVADFLHAFILDIIAQGIYDRAASLLDGAKQVVYVSDNLAPRTVVSQASTSVGIGNTTFGPYTRTASLDRLFLVYWTSSDIPNMGIGPDLAGATDIAIWIQRTVVADEFEVVVRNNTGSNKNVEFAVMALRFA